MRVIETQPGARFLVQLDGAVGEMEMGVVVDFLSRRAFPPLPVNSILARGYWIEALAENHPEWKILSEAPL